MIQLNKINEVLENIKELQRVFQEYSDSRKTIDEVVRKEIMSRKEEAERILKQIKL